MTWKVTNQAALEAAGITEPNATHIYINQNEVYTNTFMIFTRAQHNFTIKFYYQEGNYSKNREVRLDYSGPLNTRQHQVTMKAALHFLNVANPPVPQCYGLLAFIADLVKNKPENEPLLKFHNANPGFF